MPAAAVWRLPARRASLASVSRSFMLFRPPFRCGVVVAALGSRLTCTVSRDREGRHDGGEEEG